MSNLQEHVDEFNKQGFTVFRGAISDEWAEQLKSGIYEYNKEPVGIGQDVHFKNRMFERGEVYLRLIENAPVVDFAEAMLGSNCHMFAMNAFLASKNIKNDGTWHVDEDLFFPMPDDVEIDPRIQMPTFLVTCIYYLTDVTADMGPTQLIPGSHRSGHKPPTDQDLPTYKGQEPVSIIAKKGDCLVFSGQVWHRGSVSTSETDRVVQQVMYGRRWISQRFYPFINYVMPQKVIDYAAGNKRLTRLLGFHAPGPYG